MLRGLLNRLTRDAPPVQERRSYTEAVSDYLERYASGGEASRKTAFREIAAGMWGRAFASATVTPQNIATRALTPPILEAIGRALLDPGEIALEIVVDGGAVTLRPAESFTVTGGLDWTYELRLAGPSRDVERVLPADAVVHLRYGADASEPWKGKGPLASSDSTGRLSHTLERRLKEEAGARVGFLLPVPQVKQELQDDLNALEGKIALVETTAGSWGADTPAAAPKGDYDPKRLGATFTPNHEPLRDAVGRSILAACGVPASLLGNSDGTAMREGQRQFLHGTIGPVAAIVASELADKLDTPGLAFSFKKLFASDVTGRARAAGTLVQAGVEIGPALAIAGLEDE